MAALHDILIPFMIIYYILESIVRLIFPRPPQCLGEKVVLVTGAAQGIGLAIAKQFHLEGCTVVLTDIAQDGVQREAEKINEAGGTAYAYCCDVTNKEQVKVMADKVRQDVGDVDILVNNAGILVGGEIFALSESSIRKTMDVNTISHFWTIQEFLPAMLKRKYGHIVAISSMAGVSPSACLTDYCCSKWAVFGIMQALQEEFRKAKANVQAHVVCPLFVGTNMLKATDFMDRMDCNIGAEKMMGPEEVGVAVVEGVKNRIQHIFIPEKMRFICRLSFFVPDKATDLMMDFFEMGFWPKQVGKSTYN